MADRLHIHAPLVIQHAEPSERSEPTNTLLYGEEIERIEEHGEWSKVRHIYDGYEGFIQSSLLAPHHKKTHRVGVTVTNLYNEPDFKTLTRHPLYFGSPLSGTDHRKEGFLQLENKEWVFEDHLMSIEQTLPDFVETALMFLNAPYVWGGRSIAGIDCSGLVQIALMAAGIESPRDTKDQIHSVGQNVEFGDTIQYAQLQRGDLVFFERHVGIMVDDKNILNATSRHMKVLIEPLETVEKSHDGILAIRRV